MKKIKVTFNPWFTTMYATLMAAFFLFSFTRILVTHKMDQLAIFFGLAMMSLVILIYLLVLMAVKRKYGKVI